MAEVLGPEGDVEHVEEDLPMLCLDDSEVEDESTSE